MSQIVWVGSDGVQARSASFWTNYPELYSLGGSAILSALQGLSFAQIAAYQAIDLFPNGGPPPGAGADVLDAACFVFATARGSQVKILALSADPSIYLSDGESVDPSNGAVISFIAACNANGLSTRGGDGVVTWLRGYRVRLPASPIYRY